MKLSDARLLATFQTAEGRLWRITDIGQRTITAIVIELPDGRLPTGVLDAAWLNGPPYVVEEVVFDEHALQQAFTSSDAAILDAVHRYSTSAHPGFPLDAVRRMHDRTTSHEHHPVPGLLRFDRWDATLQDVLHPYDATRDGETWQIHLYRLFTQTFEHRSDLDFMALPIATESHLHTARTAHPLNPDAPA